MREQIIIRNNPGKKLFCEEIREHKKVKQKSKMNHIEKFSREDLLRLVQVYAKNWLAHDGCWFLATEEKFGMETALEIDRKSWHRFASAEAKRIIKEFGIPKNGGLDALENAMKFRLYAVINRQETEWINDKTMVFRMMECRVQKNRTRKGLAEFPCKKVGIVEFSQFAKTVDSRIKTRCLSCPPDPVTDFYCGWEFTI